MPGKKDLTEGVLNRMTSVKEPLVSICIPVYNNPEDVRRLLLSIEKQSYQNIEINISDDSDDARIEEMIRTKDTLNELLSVHTEKTKEEVKNETERDLWLTPAEAKAFGLIDGIWTGEGDRHE